MRVLHVIPSVAPGDGGPSRAIAMMERALTDAGVRVTTLATDHAGPHMRLDADARAPCANGAARVYVRKWADPYKLAPGSLSALAALVRTHDVVHVHALFSFTSTAAAWVARASGTPVVIRPLGTLAAYGMAARRSRLKRVSFALNEGPMLRAAAAVHFTSEAEMAEANALGVPMRGVVIPLGVEAGAPAPRGERGARCVILFLSRLDPKKNIEALIDAIACSPRLRAGAVLRIAGDGAPGYVASLRARVEAAGLDGGVDWLGRVDGEAKAAAFAQADIFVLPSISENFGIAAAEAMLAGLPCVLSHGVGIADDAAAAHAAVAVAPDAASVARALEALIDDAPARATLGAHAARFAREAYSTQTMARRLIALYESIMLSRGAAR